MSEEKNYNPVKLWAKIRLNSDYTTPPPTQFFPWHDPEIAEHIKKQGRVLLKNGEQVLTTYFEAREALKRVIKEFLAAGGTFKEVNRIYRNTPNDEFINKLHTLTKTKMDTNELKQKATETATAVSEEAKHLAAEVKEGAEHAVDAIKEGATGLFNKAKGLFGHHDDAPAAPATDDSKKA